mmetsp:Transcript_17324/g.35168  ORF Transcript_17324/g.35168 Transcript_17324/m.35168 type:complete len:248 (-) Transcript_17324:954-1697(-)
MRDHKGESRSCKNPSERNHKHRILLEGVNVVVVLFTSNAGCKARETVPLNGVQRPGDCRGEGKLPSVPHKASEIKVVTLYKANILHLPSIYAVPSETFALLPGWKHLNCFRSQSNCDDWPLLCNAFCSLCNESLPSWRSRRRTDCQHHAQLLVAVPALAVVLRESVGGVHRDDNFPLKCGSIQDASVVGISNLFIPATEDVFDHVNRVTLEHLTVPVCSSLSFCMYNLPLRSLDTLVSRQDTRSTRR